MARKTILVVDDEEGMRNAVKLALEDEEFDIVEADNGATALDLAKSIKPHLIISDIMMDSGSGFLLREMLKEEEETAVIPMILMSATAQSAGAWGTEEDLEYLDKPFKTEDLVGAVKRALRRAEEG